MQLAEARSPTSAEINFIVQDKDTGGPPVIRMWLESLICGNGAQASIGWHP